ncbi:MAG: GNAT family N-acetyltransferase [Gammaproteobacteria bacterium]|nr:GNAT family N-acetyltransferase [Gammaproteobacteria bacterium]
MTRDAPPGHLREVVTYLQMTAPPAAGALPPRLENLTLLRARRPPVSFYRYLYNTVGEPWLWHERRRLGDDSLRAIIHHPKVKISVLYCDGVPAGYGELDCRAGHEVELAYFGLIPDFIGRGLGGFLLHRLLAQAWSEKPRRVWVHTCNFDHPKALALYQRNGFAAYRQETRIIPDPRAINRDR